MPITRSRRRCARKTDALELDRALGDLNRAVSVSEEALSSVKARRASQRSIDTDTDTHTHTEIEVEVAEADAIRVARSSRQVAFRTNQRVNTEALMHVNKIYRKEMAIKDTFQKAILQLLLREEKAPPINTPKLRRKPILGFLDAVDLQLLGRGFHEWITQRVNSWGNEARLVAWSHTTPWVNLDDHTKDLLESVLSNPTSRFIFPGHDDEPNALELCFLSRALRVPEPQLSQFFQSKSPHSKHITQMVRCVVANRSRRKREAYENWKRKKLEDEMEAWDWDSDV